MRLQPIIVPGWGNSGPDHWQSHWETRLPRAIRVQQSDWTRPTAPAWTHAVAQAIDNAMRPPLLIAHSLGCIAVALLPEPVLQRVAGALLVAPADTERPQAPPALAEFAPVPTGSLPFPSLVVASDNDPYCRLERAAGFARSWRSDFIVLEQAGHINAATGLGDWPQGLRLLTRLRRRCCWRFDVPAPRKITAMPTPQLPSTASANSLALKG